jgi:hypothetical protein
MENIRIRDRGKNSDPGSEINIPDPQHWKEEEDVTDVLALPGKRGAHF